MATYKHGKRINYNGHIIAIVIVIIFAAILFLAWPRSSAGYLTSPQQFTIPAGTSINVRIPGTAQVASIYVKNSSNSSALIYETEVPILSKPIVAFELSRGQSVNISSNQSGISNINVLLVSSSPTAAVLKLSPIPTNLGIKQSKGVAVFPPMSLSISINSSMISSNKTSTQTVTTISTTTIPTTTAPTTTTISVLNTNVMGFANNTAIGVLMGKYNTLYKESLSCNETLYNNTFLRINGKLPSAEFSFQNVSAETPYAINVSIRALNAQDFGVTYSQKSKSSFSSGPIVYMEINTSTSPYTIVSAQFIGQWQGLNLTIAQNAYNYALGIGNACGAQMMQSYKP